MSRKIVLDEAPISSEDIALAENQSKLEAQQKEAELIAKKLEDEKYIATRRILDIEIPLEPRIMIGVVFALSVLIFAVIY